MDYEITVDEPTAALRRIPFFLPSSTDGFTPVTGKLDADFFCRLSKNGTSVDHAGTFVEIDAVNVPGVYYYEATVGEVDTAGWLVLVISCADCVTQRITVRVGAANIDIEVDVSGLALEANVQGHAADALTAYDPPTRAEATADKNAIIAAVPSPTTIDAQLSSTHGSGSWEDSGGNGSGASVATVTVQDDISSESVPEVLVQVFNESLTVLLRWAITNANGQVVFNLDDGTYKLMLRKHGSYSFSNPETLVVSGTTSDTYDGTAILPSSAPSPETCVLYGTTYNASDEPVSVEVIVELVCAIHFTQTGIQVIKGPLTVTSSAVTGYWEVVLTRSGEYTRATVVYSVRVNGVVMGSYLIPDQANVNLADLTPYTP